MRWLRWIAAAFGAVLVGLVALILLLAYRPSIIANEVRNRVLPRISQQMGRELTVGRIEPKLLPLPQARVEDFKLEGFKGDAPLVRADAVSFRIELWPLLRSFGKDVQLSAIELEGPEINLVRNRRGVWNYEGLGSEDEPSQRRVSVSEVRLRDGAVRVVDRSAPGDPTAVALRSIDATVRDVGAGRPTSLDLRAAFASAAQNLRLDLTATPRGDQPAELVGKFSLDRAAISQLKSLMPEGAAATITGGAVSLDGHIATRDAAYLVEANARTDELALRGGPAKASFRASSRIDPNKPQAATVELDRIVVQGPGIDLKGQANLRAEPMRARFALEGPLLDLNTLMAALPESQPAERQAGEPLLPESLRNQLAAADVKGSLNVAKLVAGKLTASNLRAQAGLERGELVLTQAVAELYGGALDASGTRIDLSKPDPGWRLRAQLAQVDLGLAMKEVTGAAPLGGVFGGKLDLTGMGLAWERLRSNLSGTGAVQLRDGMLSSVDLAEQLAGRVNEALRLTGRAVGGSGDPTTLKGTPLRQLATGITVRDGWIQFQRPVTFGSDFGSAQLGGRLGLDQRIDLKGDAALSPEFIARVAGGLNPGGPVSIPLALGGSLQAPGVTTSTQEIARSLVSSPSAAARRKAEEIESGARKQAEQEVRGRLKGIFGQ